MEKNAGQQCIKYKPSSDVTLTSVSQALFTTLLKSSSKISLVPIGTLIIPLDIVISKQHIRHMMEKFNSFPFTNKEFVIRKTVKSIRSIEMYASFSTSVFLCHQVSEEIFYGILFCSYSLTKMIF